MPELPEIEALVRAIDKLVAAHPIAGPPIAHFAVLKTGDPPLVGVAGQRLLAARRRAKQFLFPVGDGTTLTVHLMAAGRLAYCLPGEKLPGAAVLTVRFEDGGAIVVTESGKRRNVRIGLYTPEGLAAHLDGLGPEPLDESFDRAAFDAVLDQRPRQLNSLLRDQRMIAGIGRAFADEILHDACLSPFAISTRLGEEGRERLFASIKDVLAAGVAICEERQGLRMPQKNDARLLRIHKHDGEPCPRCGETLRFVDFESNRIVYCPKCQTDGRELADRRLSKLLR